MPTPCDLDFHFAVKSKYRFALVLTICVYLDDFTFSLELMNFSCDSLCMGKHKRVSTSRKQ